MKILLMNSMKKKSQELISDESLNKLFHSLYFKELSQGDEFIESLWNRIFPSTKQMLSTIGLKDCQTVGYWIVSFNKLVEKTRYYETGKDYSWDCTFFKKTDCSFTIWRWSC